MLTVQRFHLLKLIFQKSNKINVISSTFSSFTARDFLYDDSHGETGTLNTRFMKHIAIECNKHEKIIHQTIKYADYFPINDIYAFSSTLNDTSIEQLPRLVIFAYTYKSNADGHKFSRVLNEIDKFCVKNINKFDYNSLLNMLYAFTYLIPNKITLLDFYKMAIQNLIQNFNTDLPKETFVQVCYYVGLLKKNYHNTELMRDFLYKNLNNYLMKLDKLNFIIVANAAFKTSVVLLNDDFSERLKQELLNCNYNDDGLLITLIKSIRLERIKSENIYNKIKTLLINNKLKKYDFKGFVHIFALYSDGLWNDKEICEILIKKCLEKLYDCGIDGELFNDIREKDISTFLWCLSYLRCTKINNNDLKFIEEIILSRIYREKYKYCPDELIDSILSLWTMNYKSEKLIEEILQLNMNPKLKRNERIKLDSRLQLLINCVQIEKPEWLTDKSQKLKVFQENHKAPEYLLKDRDNLNKLSEILQENKNKIDIKTIQFVTPINELNIANILLELNNGQKLHIETVEKNQMLKFDNKESALVQLKIRLLTKSGCNVILIKPDELDNQDELLNKIRVSNLEKTNSQPVQEKEMIN